MIGEYFIEKLEEDHEDATYIAHNFGGLFGWGNNIIYRINHEIIILVVESSDILGLHAFHYTEMRKVNYFMFRRCKGTEFPYKIKEIYNKYKNNELTWKADEDVSYFIKKEAKQ